MRHAKSRHTKEAFEWIISILRNHKIPFEIIGGFAARLYGSRRMLADIDIDIPKKKIKRILSEANK